jgi:hypothetical protein
MLQKDFLKKAVLGLMFTATALQAQFEYRQGSVGLGLNARHIRTSPDKSSGYFGGTDFAFTYKGVIGYGAPKTSWTGETTLLTDFSMGRLKAAELVNNTTSTALEPYTNVFAQVIGMHHHPFYLYKDNIALELGYGFGVNSDHILYDNEIIQNQGRPDETKIKNIGSKNLYKVPVLIGMGLRFDFPVGEHQFIGVWRGSMNLLGGNFFNGKNTQTETPVNTGVNTTTKLNQNTSTFAFVGWNDLSLYSDLDLSFLFQKKMGLGLTYNFAYQRQDYKPKDTQILLPKYALHTQHLVALKVVYRFASK